MGKIFCANHRDVPARFKCSQCGQPFCKTCVERLGNNFICKDCVGQLASNIEKNHRSDASSLGKTTLHLSLSFIGVGMLILGVLGGILTIKDVVTAAAPHAFMIASESVVFNDTSFTILLNIILSLVFVFQGWGLIARSRMFFWSGLVITFAYALLFALRAASAFQAAGSVCEPVSKNASLVAGVLFILLLTVISKRDFSRA